MSHDDFLIIGITGAFASGCTEASTLFQNTLSSELQNLISRKSQINSEIAGIYNAKSSITNDGSEIISSRRQLKQLLRTRSLLINAEKTQDVPQFLYISMTVVMYSLTLNWAVKRHKKSEIEERYIPLYEIIKDWAKENGFDSKQIGTIENTLKNRTYKNWPLIQKYYSKIGELKDSVANEYKNNPLDLFRLMQGVGNNLRKCGRPFDENAHFNKTENLDILSQASCSTIKLHRKWQIKSNKIKKTYYVVECLRNPSEIEYFRRRFYEFYLLSIYCDEKLRHTRAAQKYHLKSVDCIIIDKQDQGSSRVENLYKQNIKKCVNLADIAIINTSTKHDLYAKLVRYFILIKNPGCITPNRNERNMHLAYSLSLSSTCISRKVGAVIVKDECIVGSGWNDTEVNRIGCGYRIISDLEETDNTSLPLANIDDYDTLKDIISNSTNNKDNSFCYKDEYGKLTKHKTEAIEDCCKSMLNNINTSSLQQCRALHAEENAILQSARIGGISINGSTLFTTTFPCELCAKKIMQVGITTITYCEPYPKSVSLDVFFKEGFKRIKIKPFEGVKSPSYYKLFKSTYDLKDRQALDSYRNQDSQRL